MRAPGWVWAGTVAGALVAGCARRPPRPLTTQMSADAESLGVTLRLVQGGVVVLERMSTVQLGQPVEWVTARQGDREPLSVALWVPHDATRYGAFFVRTAIRRGTEILFAPVLWAQPGAPARFQGSVDDEDFRLVVQIDPAD